MIEVTNLNRVYVPSGTTTVTLTYVASAATAALDGKTFTLIPAHTVSQCSGNNCCKHPFKCPLFTEMERGDSTWGSMLCK